MTKLKDVIETLDKAADSFDGIADAEQRKIYEEVITLAKDLDTDMFGKVKQSIANLKRLTQIKAKLAALSKDKEWVAGISGFARYFGELQQMQNAYYSEHFPKHTLSMQAKEKNNLMRQMAIQNTMDALMGDGLKANVTDKLNDILLRAVTTGSKFADLQDELRAHLKGKEGGQGAFARYATTYATTALSQFTGQQNKLLSEGLDTEWYMYTGSNKETTREFCQHLTAKKYIHKSEIPTILTGKIEYDGEVHECAIYEKTGLPYGMIEGTTPENFQCNCGGWNCRHQLVPVADAVVPQQIRDRIRIQQKLAEYKENGKKYEYPQIKGKLLALDPASALIYGAYQRVQSIVGKFKDIKSHRKQQEALREITEMQCFETIDFASTKKGAVYGFLNQQFDYRTEGESHKNAILASKVTADSYNVYLIPNTGNKSSSADFILEKEGKYLYFEGKVTTGKNAIENGINNAKDQSDKVMIDIAYNMPEKMAKTQIKKAFSSNRDIKELWIYRGKRKLIVTRQWVFSSRFDREFGRAWI